MLRAGLAYLPQRPSLFPYLTVESNLRLGLWHARPKKAVLAEKLERADERTAGVDPQTSEIIYGIVRDLARDLGKAVLLVDQDIRAALAITDYVYVVKNGAVFSEGAREDFGNDTDALVARWLYASGE